MLVCGIWQRAAKNGERGKKVKNAHGCVTRVGARGRPQRCRWCTPRRVRRSLLDSPPGAGSAPTSRTFHLIVGHDGIYGVPAGVYRATGRQSVTRIAVGLSAIPSPAGTNPPGTGSDPGTNPGRGDKVLTIWPGNGGSAHRILFSNDS